MLEKPALQDDRIVACLRDEYGLAAAEVAFLPLGADRNTAVYRVTAGDGMPYFLKLRRGTFDDLSVALPKFLGDQGIAQVIVPLATRLGRLWTTLDAFSVILYPFVEGRNGYEVDLTDRHWSELGTALRRIHTAVVPPALAGRVRQETYSPQWRASVKAFLARIEEGDTSDDPVAVKTAGLLKARRSEILDLVARAGHLARVLQARSREFVVCHSDIHAGNVLIGSDGAFYIVDWDDPILAPKERDLMYVGGGQMAGERTPQEEEALFYPSYGPAAVDPDALAYYRYERIVQDIAVYCEQLLLTSEGGDDREQSFRYLASNFLPGGVLQIARDADSADWADRVDDGTAGKA